MDISGECGEGCDCFETDNDDITDEAIEREISDTLRKLGIAYETGTNA